MAGLMMIKKLLVILLLSLFTQFAMAAIVVANPQGTVTLTEVLDYQCGHCRHMQTVINWLMTHDANLKIRIIPVAIINEYSLVAATSSYVMAKRLPNFLKYHEFLMSHAINARGIANILNQLHFNTQTCHSEMHQAWILKEMASGLALLKQYHSGTPLLLIYPNNNPKNPYVFRC